MGCCASSTETSEAIVEQVKTPDTDGNKITTEESEEAPETAKVKTPDDIVENQITTDKSESKKSATTTPNPSMNPSSGITSSAGAKAAPAPGVKHVRAAYSGKGWAPPQKEWESKQIQKGDKTRIEIEDEWDDDGNLKRTTTKHITTPKFEKKTEKTIELIPAAEAEKMGLGRK